LNWDRCRPSLAQGPDLRPASQRRPGAGAVARLRGSRRIAQRLIRRTETLSRLSTTILIVAVMPGDQKIRIGRGDDDIIGTTFSMVCGDGQFASPHQRRDGSRRTDRERGLVAEIDLADVVLSDIGVDMKDGEICCDEKSGAVSEPTATIWPIATLRETTVPSIGETISCRRD